MPGRRCRVASFPLEAAGREGCAPFPHPTTDLDVTARESTNPNQEGRNPPLNLLSADFDAPFHHQQIPEEDTTPDTWTRVLCGTVVQFGEGAAVTKASLQSDFSAVHLSMLPPGSSPATISTLLTQLGFPTPPECIRVPPTGENAPVFRRKRQSGALHPHPSSARCTWVRSWQ